jgi:hypothetical protein
MRLFPEGTSLEPTCTGRKALSILPDELEHSGKNDMEEMHLNNLDISLLCMVSVYVLS